MAEDNKIKQRGIFITDIQAHTAKANNPTPWYRAILKSFTNKKPGRIYSNQQIKFSNWRTENGVTKAHFSIPLPDGYKEKIEEMKKQGKEFTIFVPKEGIPIYASKDMVECINGKNNRWAKRIWQKYTKN
jgi:hypothetical protein